MPHDNSRHFLVMIIEKFRFFLLRMYSFDENENGKSRGCEGADENGPCGGIKRLRMK